MAEHQRRENSARVEVAKGPPTWESNPRKRAFTSGEPDDPTRTVARSLPRKEVIQPHLPVRLPCYDLAPITGLTLGT
jgi:hypothetical protein